MASSASSGNPGSLAESMKNEMYRPTDSTKSTATDPPAGSSGDGQALYPQLKTNYGMEVPASEEFAPNANAKGATDDEMPDALAPVQSELAQPTNSHRKFFKNYKIADLMRNWWLAEQGKEKKMREELDEFNLKISAYNQNKKLDPTLGTVPMQWYATQKETVEPEFRKIREKGGGRGGFNKVKFLVDEKNQIFGLPKSWGFPEDYFEKRTGLPATEILESIESSSNKDQGSKRAKESKDKPSERKRGKQRVHESENESDSEDEILESIGSSSKKGQRSKRAKDSKNKASERKRGKQRVHESENESDSEDESENESESEYDDRDESDVETDIDDTPLGLAKALEKHYPGMRLLGEVVAYKKCGSGHQCLVKYSNEHGETFRLVPGSSVGAFTQEGVTNLVTGQRGHLKDETGLKWRFTGADIERLAHVAWRADESNPLDSLNPSTYKADGNVAGTFVSVIWKDGRHSWETRTTIRRLLGNFQLKADFQIYLRAKAQEKRYNKGKIQGGLPTITHSSKERVRRAGSTRPKEANRLPSSRANTARFREAPEDPSTELFTSSEGTRKRSKSTHPRLPSQEEWERTQRELSQLRQRSRYERREREMSQMKLGPKKRRDKNTAERELDRVYEEE